MLLEVMLTLRIGSSVLNVQLEQTIVNVYPICRLIPYLLSILLFTLVHISGVSDMLMLGLFIHSSRDCILPAGDNEVTCWQ